MALEETDGGKTNTPQEEKKTVVDTGITAKQYKEQQLEIAKLQEQLGDLIKLQTTSPAGASNTDLGNADAMATVIKAINAKSDEEKYGIEGTGYVTEDDMDPEDRLEIGEHFYCHAGGYLIVDDLRNGRPVATPFRNALMFTPFKTTKTGSGKDMVKEVVSRYTSHSKKEVAWLKDSSFYGWKIFDDLQSATTAHGKLAHAINRNLTSAKTMTTGTLVAECKTLGISQNTDLNSMRLLYATAKAQAEIGVAEQKQLLRSRNAGIEAQMLKEA